jgi:hypothetical protein
MHEAAADERTDACPAAAEAPDRIGDARTLPLPLPVNGMEAARGHHVGSQLLQPEQEDRATPAVEHGTGGYLSVTTDGTNRVPFRATGTVHDDTIPFGSFFTADAAAREQDGWAATTPGLAPNLPAGYEGGGASASRQRAALPTRPGAHVHGLPQQRDGDDADEHVLLVASDCQLTDSDRSDADDTDGDGVASIEWVECDTPQPKSPASGITLGSRAECAQYVGVHLKANRAANPFQANVHFHSKLRHICACSTAEAAARAYDAVACLIPGRELNFPTTIPAAASSSRQQEGASAVPPKESDILAAIAAVREAQPEPSRGAVNYIGVTFNHRSALNPYRAVIRIDGKGTHLSSHSTAEAAARAYDAVASTIPGRKLNFPIDGSSAVATAEGFRTAARSLPARDAGQPSHPPPLAPNDDGSSKPPPPPPQQQQPLTAHPHRIVPIFVPGFTPAPAQPPAAGAQTSVSSKRRAAEEPCTCSEAMREGPGRRFHASDCRRYKSAKRPPEAS